MKQSLSYSNHLTPFQVQQQQQELRQRINYGFNTITDVFNNVSIDNYDALVKELLPLFLEENFELDEALFKKGLVHSVSSHKYHYRDSGVPFAVHEVCAAFLVNHWRLGDEWTISALLHDVPEDSDDKNKALNDIRRLFGENVARNVNLCTMTGEDLEKKDFVHYRKIIGHVNEHGYGALFLFLADKVHNFYTIRDMLPKHGLTANERQELYAEKIRSLSVPVARFLDRKDVVDLRLEDYISYLSVKLGFS